jgi:hypothetical protein
MGPWARADLGDPDFTVDDGTPLVVEEFRLTLPGRETHLTTGSSM